MAMGISVLGVTGVVHFFVDLSGRRADHDAHLFGTNNHHRRLLCVPTPVQTLLRSQVGITHALYTFFAYHALRSPPSLTPFIHLLSPSHHLYTYHSLHNIFGTLISRLGRLNFYPTSSTTHLLRTILLFDLSHLPNSRSKVTTSQHMIPNLHETNSTRAEAWPPIAAAEPTFDAHQTIKL